MKKQEQCPTKDLLKYFEAAKTDSLTALPVSIANHAKNCEACAALLSMPAIWEAYIEANKSAVIESAVTAFSISDIKEGLVCRVKANDNVNSSLALITSVNKDNDFIRVSPIAVSPLDRDIDKETDILVSPEDMPNGLPSLIEWWNDRPVMTDSIDLLLGKISDKLLNSIKAAIKNQKAPAKGTKAIYTFREIEKNKGNQLSASFFEKYLTAEAREEEVLEPARHFELVTITFAANEELAMAAASNDLFERIKDGLSKQSIKEYVVNRIQGSNGFTIFSTDKKAFTLDIIFQNSHKEFKSSGNKLYLRKSDIEELGKIEKIERLEFRKE